MYWYQNKGKERPKIIKKDPIEESLDAMFQQHEQSTNIDPLEPTTFVWTTKNGREMFVSEMDDKHLMNSISYLQRRLQDIEDLSFTAERSTIVKAVLVEAKKKVKSYKKRLKVLRIEKGRRLKNYTDQIKLNILKGKYHQNR